jgi:hypothetical protein
MTASAAGTQSHSQPVGISIGGLMSWMSLATAEVVWFVSMIANPSHLVAPALYRFSAVNRALPKRQRAGAVQNLAVF